MDKATHNRNNEQKKRADRLSHLIYTVFSTDEGRELLDLWRESLILYPTAQAGMDMVGIGIEEGKKGFIRGIINTLKTRELQ